jgi:hypothetical protein
MLIESRTYNSQIKGYCTLAGWLAELMILNKDKRYFPLVNLPDT